VTSYDPFPDDLLAAVPEPCSAVGEHQSIHEADSHYLARQLPVSPLSRGGIGCD
jgi:hypothetical protein